MLKDLIKQQSAASSEIHDKVTAFLRALDKTGTYAPTITACRGGYASLGEIEIEGDNVVINYEISYSGGDNDRHSLTVPVATVEDPSETNIAAYLAAEAEKARLEQVEKDKKSIIEYKGNLWSPIQSLKRLGVPLKDILSQVETHYNWVDPKAQEQGKKK